MRSRKCPHCAEMIQEDAKKCRYCGEWLVKEKKSRGGWFFQLLLWLGSLFLWFLYAYKTLDRSKEAYEYTLDSGPMFSGYSLFILGLLLAFLLRKQVFIKRLNIKSVLAKLLVIFVVVLGLWTQLSFDPLPSNTISLSGYSQDKDGLRKANEQQNRLAEKGDESSIREIYREFLSPKDRTMSENEFVKGSLQINSGKFLNIVVNDVKVEGSTGYVDRSLVFCTNKECSVIEGKTRSFRVYEYENGRWYYRVKDVLCPRTTLYEMEPEFSRAISLIQQRALSPTAGEYGEVADDFKRMMNCVKIAYAPTESDMDGAEGVFRFVPGQSPEYMTIFVSPRYKSKDDILTATLLTHELMHTYNYVLGLYNGEETDCYEDEAFAFSAQNSFISTLNDEERQSIISRYAQGGSPELVNIIRTYSQIQNTKGATYLDKALSYVRSHPGYQQQCSER